MKKEKRKKEKGISLLTLTITIAVLLILTNVIIYNIKDNLKIGNLKKMQNDIGNLRDKISSYYQQNGKIPARVKYTNIEPIKQAGLISENIDMGDFLVIDLSAIENLSLNYGREYEKVKENPEKANYYTDLYIINQTSHNIFYVRGVSIDEQTFYTDYTNEDIDTKAVDLRYCDNVKIPQGFYYVGGNKDTGIIISDKEGDDLENTKQGNQFVWVPVENFEDFERYDFGTQNIAISSFITPQPSDGKYYEEVADGITNETEFEKMYQSVKNNKGFYIARFEAGTTQASGSGIRGDVVSKKGVAVYNNIKWANSVEDETGGALQVAREMYPSNNTQNEVTSTLCYGVQWDAVMRWISQDSILKEYLTNSANIGNYETSSAITTGSNDKYQIKNIYDMAGNVYEWTMEMFHTENISYRGGSYQYSGEEKTIAYRGYDNPTGVYNDLGFRVTLYLKEEEKWSPTYDKEATYQDKNGDIAYIPKGFKVSEKFGENTIDEGLVVKDGNENEWVWIEVPQSIYATATSELDYTNIEKDMQNYVIDYRQEGYSDTWNSAQEVRI